jgi:carbonic anhydrase/acetyltransferase-like protein (isoleucine patch superfamily)
MIVEHRGSRPSIHPEATLCPGAIVSGNVVLGAGTVVLAGAVVTSEGAPVRVGTECVIMENAVVRGAGNHPCTLGNNVLVGPHSHVSGATVEADCFLATASTLLNGAFLGRGSTAALRATAHVGSRCPPGTLIPIGYIAFGDPARILPPEAAPEVLHLLGQLGFTRTVFGFDSAHMPNAEATRELCRRYARSLRAHRDDRIVERAATTAS